MQNINLRLLSFEKSVQKFYLYLEKNRRLRFGILNDETLFIKNQRFPRHFTNIFYRSIFIEKYK